MTIYELASKHERTRQTYRQLFYDTFKVDINKFWSKMFGFDVIKFDDLIAPEENQSTRDRVVELYGEEAANLIEKLIGSPAANIKAE